MADEFKSIRDNLFRALAGRSFGERDEDDDELSGSASGLDASAAKALIGALFARAGKGKDEVVQTMAREIGLAVAAMLKEPLAQLAKNQKLQISFEFVPKAPVAGEATPDKTPGDDDPPPPTKPRSGSKSRKKAASAAHD